MSARTKARVAYGSRGRARTADAGIRPVAPTFGKVRINDPATGRRHPGATQIKFNGSATVVRKNGRCVIGGAKVSLSTKLMLPRWTNRRRANRQMGLIWDTLAADIKRHEERHAEIARTHARDLEKTILGLSAARDCPTLKARVNRVSQDAMISHDKDQMRFDRIESANFENRMIRLLKYRISQQAEK